MLAAEARRDRVGVQKLGGAAEVGALRSKSNRVGRGVTLDPVDPVFAVNLVVSTFSPPGSPGLPGSPGSKGAIPRRCQTGSRWQRRYPRGPAPPGRDDVTVDSGDSTAEVTFDAWTNIRPRRVSVNRLP